MNLKIVAATLAALASAVLGAVAQAAPDAKPLTGTWSGKTSQDIFITDPATGEDIESEWSVRFTVSAQNGHVANLFTTVRVVCPGPAVRDIRVKRDWRSGKGPKLSPSGSFSARIKNPGSPMVNFAGVLGGVGGTGRFDASAGGCSGTGSWRVKRKL